MALALALVLAVEALLLANGLVNKASADVGACKPVKVCEAVKAVPACKPVRPLPLPEACKPVKVCDPVDAREKHVVLHDRVARFAWRFKKHTVGYEVYQDKSLPATSTTSPTPAPAPQPTT